MKFLKTFLTLVALDLESYQISYDLKWREWGIFTTFVVFNVAVTLLAASFLTARYAKR